MLKRITKRHLIGGGTALVIMLVAFAVIWGAWRDSRNAKPIPLENPAEVYSEAVAALQSRENIYYRVEGVKTTTVGTTTLEENFTQLITCEAQGTEQMRVCVEETLSVGSYDIKRFDFFADGNEYLTVQGSSFQAAVTAEDFAKNFTPVVLIDPSLYADINGITTAKDTIISFAKPAAMEAWAADSGTELVSSEGVAYLNDVGELTSCFYVADYRQGDVTFFVHYTVEVISGEVPPIQLPDSSAYTSISGINTPYMLEKACGYLMSIGGIRSEYSDTIACQAFGDERTQTIRLLTDGTDGWSAQVDTSVSVSNSSKAGVVSAFSKSERFADNVYTSSTDGGEFVSNPDVDLTVMNSYCQNLLIGTLMLPQYITATELSEVEDIYSISFQASEEFAQILAEEACTTLYQTPSVLTDLAQASATDTVTCYLNISKVTGLPVSSGFYYQGTYTISDLPYQLSFKADQTYTLPTEIVTEESTEATEYTEAQEAKAS